MFRDGARHRRPDDAVLRKVLRGAAETLRRFGFQRMHVMLRRDGHVLNRNRMHWICREQGPSVRRRRSWNRDIGTRASLVAKALANAGGFPDCVQDQFADGRRYRILNMVDDVTAETSPGFMSSRTGRKNR